MNTQQEEEELRLADAGTLVNVGGKARYSPPSTTSATSTTSTSSGDGAWHKSNGKALNSKPSSNATGSCHDNSQAPLEPSTTRVPPKKPRNPLLTWTKDELRLVAKFRQGMINTSRRKRPKKPKDAPKRPLR